MYVEGLKSKLISKSLTIKLDVVFKCSNFYVLWIILYHSIIMSVSAQLSRNSDKPSSCLKPVFTLNGSESSLQIYSFNVLFYLLI